MQSLQEKASAWSGVVAADAFAIDETNLFQKLGLQKCSDMSSTRESDTSQPTLIGRHRPFPATHQAAERWLHHMEKALENTPEERAIERGMWFLKYAWELGIDRLRMESDCERAIQTLENRGARHTISIVHHIWELLDKQWEVRLRVIGQESNKVTDSLAHFARKLPFGFHDFVESPNVINGLVLSDLPS
ncbi:hypothetical protein V6N11_054082 [Hibiscus sabdariffa]|uniref:RNase H type-1 domain-containing protein n=1 Tax=Hibiscus sabdariffa TaxID=183260 RepID=A0ABR2S3Q3_9ROSI